LRLDSATSAQNDGNLVQSVTVDRRAARLATSAQNDGFTWSLRRMAESTGGAADFRRTGITQRQAGPPGLLPAAAVGQAGRGPVGRDGERVHRVQARRGGGLLNIVVADLAHAAAFGREHPYCAAVVEHV
jgi:hypothetical protein